MTVTEILAVLNDPEGYPKHVIAAMPQKLGVILNLETTVGLKKFTKTDKGWVVK